MAAGGDFPARPGYCRGTTVYARAQEHEDRLLWVVEEMACDDSSLWALFYRGAALLHLEDFSGVDVLRPLADGGFGPALTELGSLFIDNGDEGRAMLRRAAGMGDVRASYLLGHRDREHRFEVWQVTAAGGHVAAMLDLFDFFGSTAVTTLMVARAVAYSGDVSILEKKSNLAGNVIIKPYNDFLLMDEQMEVLYQFGRELEGY